MKTILLTLVILTAMIGGYSIGVVRATRKSIREDRLGPALYAISVAMAREAGNQAKAEKVDRLRLKRAIEEVAALGEISWPRVILDSAHDIEGYPQFMATIADYVSKHPEIGINESAQAYIIRFKAKEPNQSPDRMPGSSAPGESGRP